MIFETKNLKSETLNKEISLEVYDSNDTKIISTNSLIAFFDSIRAERGIRTDTDVTISYGENALPVYCCCKYIIEDANGYKNTFIGESSPTTRTNEIASQNPTKMAEKRAISAGIISYLRLPGKVYSDSQMTEAPAPTKDELKNQIEELGKKAEVEAPLTEEVNAPIATTISLPEVEDDTPVVESAPIANAPEMPVEDEAIEETVSKPVVEAAPESVNTTESVATSEAVTSVAENLTVSEIPVESPTPTASVEMPVSEPSDEEVVNEDTLIGFGPAKDKTIAEAVALAGSNTPVGKFVSMIASGAVASQPGRKGEIVEYIKKLVNNK